MNENLIAHLTVLFPLVSFLATGFVWVYVYAQHNRNPVNRAFLWIAGSALGWLGSELILYLPVFSGWETEIYRLASVFWISMGLWYLEFANAITKRKRDIFSYLGLVVTIVGIGVTIFTDRIIIETLIFSWGVSPVCAPVSHSLVSLITAFLTTLGVFRIFKAWRALTDPVARKIFGLIFYGSLVTMAGIALVNVILPNFFGMTDFPRHGASALAVFVLIIFYAVTKYRFLSISLDKVAEEIYEEVTVGIVLLDRDGRVHRSNAEARRMLGAVPAGRPVSALFEDHDVSGEYLNHEIPFVRKGRLHILALSASRVARGGQRLGTILMVRDITDQKNAESVLRRSRDELEREVENRTRQLRHAQKLETIGTLAGGIAHDFNNTLSAILGFSAAARNDLPRDSLIREDLDEVILAANRGRDMVRQIMSFTRKEDKASFKVTDLNALLEETVALLRVSTPEHIEVRVATRIKSAKVSCSATQIGQVIMNLYNNACHAMKHEARGALSLTLERMDIRENYARETPYLKSGPYVRLTCRDNGTGIAREHLPNIFDPFFTTKIQGEGTGLGLSSSQVIIHNHDGEISVESAPGIGTSFSVYLPLLPSATDAPEPRPETRRETSANGHEHILWVDDEQQMLRMGKRTLSQMGYRVTTAPDGRVALDLFTRNPSGYDLVVTDFSMPGMTGTRLAKELKAVRRDVPIILVSGFGDEVPTAEIDEGGILAFFNKPVSTKELSVALRDILDA